MSKSSRHFAIKQIITSNVVSSQEDLRQYLEQDGFDVTQATLSRDMKELGVARANTSDGLRYVLRPELEEHRLKALLSYEVESIESNESVIIVKTLPGRAQGVAELIDTFHDIDVIGTIAGDNTIFIAPASTKKIPRIVARLREIIAEGE
ncbi:MAG TPA: arginine repressor [Candidatus Kapabacteria bacterium]|nr:arginine repressor [Candidatus Kapabacteria bacterium]